MSLDLPTELLRSLVAIADTGSLSRAAQRVGRSASALSLQMSKLEGIAGAALFERRGRGLVLTPMGELLLAHARAILERHDAALRALRGAANAGRVRFGLTQDFVDGLLPSLLAQLRAVHPLAQIEIRVDGSAALGAAVAAQELDLALTAAGAADAPLWREPMLWLGAPTWTQRSDLPLDLPLALVAPPCPFATAARRALETAGRAHHLTLQTPSLAGALAAVKAGLGIGCRIRCAAEAMGLAVLGPAHGLPPLPEIGYALRLGRDLSPAAATLAEMTRATVERKSI